MPDQVSHRWRVVTPAVVTVLVVAVVVLLLWRHHQHDALERTPSFRYGQSVMVYVASHGNGGVDAGQECDIALATPPPDVVGYSRAKARAGCLDEWTALNR